jgi:hypothetical protein
LIGSLSPLFLALLRPLLRAVLRCFRGFVVGFSLFSRVFPSISALFTILNDFWVFVLDPWGLGVEGLALAAR